ncbi:hypothetical protein MROS_2205 [Melioribacter roseus P3M-2]|uniref:Uncharacterized protein n=1 Tax=Melioribacter roseus (strain DSM 23840 / JCM 17771 / VKM B-2668 / P3M-2) TaxID=1191523 RepID=I6Z8F5_MELRP|nr:SIR2 family protein [Melioribacter roseus]AFN75435.1 hypothetical protein MROS_2205 [Melioribacter roseus P3M-2]
MKKIAFLFGSGLSIPAEMPSTSDITQNVLDGDNVMRHTDGNYYFGKPLYHHIGAADEYVPRVLLFLKRIKIEIDLYYWDLFHKETNYEDLYYVASQIYNSEMFIFDNPVVQPFIDKIIKEVKPILQGRPGEIRGNWELHELAHEAMNYISDIVWHHLSKEPKRLSYLNFLKDAYEDSNINRMFIFSLNHDLVIEEYFRTENISFIDGFGNPVKGVRYWNFNIFKNDEKLNIAKLHGSINWFKFSRGKYTPNEIGIPIHGNFWRTQDPNGVYRHPDNGRPMILVGTFNKILQYTYDIYFLLYYLFYNTLIDTNTIIISGYSFGDKGINTRLIEWMNSSSARKIIVIHPEVEKLKQPSSDGIYRNWDNWVNDNKLIIIEKRIEEISWDIISKNIN